LKIYGKGKHSGIICGSITHKKSFQKIPPNDNVFVTDDEVK
jgi:hypothetical protein